MKKVIGIDFDDVLMDFTPGFLSFFSKKLGKEFTKEDVTVFHFWNTFNITREEAVAICEEYYLTEEHLENLPLPDSVQSVINLAAFDLYVVTARPPFVKEATSSWVKTHFGDSFKELYFTGAFKNDSAKTKGQIAKELNMTYFIDDAPHNALDVASRGVQVFLLDAPWNRTVDITHPLVTRVSNWNEIMGHITSREQGWSYREVV